MKKNLYSVVTIYKDEGHKINGYFLTDCNITLRKFGEALGSKNAYYTQFETEKEACECIKEYCKGFVSFNPFIYIDLYNLREYFSVNSD
jgi:hypothetical protein